MALRPDRRSGGDDDDDDEAGDSRILRRCDEEKRCRLSSERSLSGHMQEMSGWNTERVQLKTHKRTKNHLVQLVFLLPFYLVVEN